MPIHIDSDKKQFTLAGKDFSYVFHVSEHGYLNHLYYGAKIGTGADLTYRYIPITTNDYSAQIDGSKTKYTTLTPEYSQSNYGDFRAGAILAEDCIGAPVIDLRYGGYEIVSEKPSLSSHMPVSRGGETLIVKLTDIHLLADIYLYYTVYEDLNILTRRVMAQNRGEKPLKLKKLMSLSLDFRDSDFELITLTGGHAAERNLNRHPLMSGFMGVGNARGVSSHQHSPFAALARPNAGEESGEVYGCSLMYSGSHLETVEVDHAGYTRLLAGINPQNFTWILEKDEKFETPEAVLCYSDTGLGKMSRSYHDFFRNFVIPPRFARKSRPVVFNSWEGLRFSFDKNLIFEYIEAIAGTGIEIFVLDDGWFGKRNGPESGLGDWHVNEEKLPGGLSVISEHCRKNGMKFGLWIEPEMVNPDSALYRSYPDWVIKAPDRAPVLSRNQCVLDLTRREVLDHVKRVMHGVIKNSGADYIKWDMNRHLTENYSAALPPHRQGELQHRYALAVYDLAAYLTGAFPDILFEGCSGGGGRFDGAMLYYFPQIWTSDDTDAHERTKIQYGTSLCFPPSTHSCHVSQVPNIRNGRICPLETRVNIACLGIFGYEFDAKNNPKEDTAKIPAQIKKYRKIDPLILSGDLYRMKNTFDSNEFSQILVSKDKKRAFLVYYQTLNPHKTAPDIKINGLDENKTYLIKETGQKIRGDVLKNVGLNLPRLPGDFASVALTFEETE